MNGLLPFPPNIALLPNCGSRNQLRFMEPAAGKTGMHHARSAAAAEGNVPSRRRIEMAQVHLSHRQKRLFLITEKDSICFAQCKPPACFSVLCRTGVSILYLTTSEADAG
jgi:hypothetical protein